MNVQTHDMSHRLSELGAGSVKAELVLSPTKKQTCTEGSSQLSALSQRAVPLLGASQRCCIQASLVENCYFLHCLREMKLLGALTTSSVVMAEPNVGFQKPFIALKCISNIFVLNMRVNFKGQWWSHLLCPCPQALVGHSSWHLPEVLCSLLS